MFEVHESVGGPEFAVEVFAGNQLAGVFEEADKDLDGLAFEADLAALLLELTGTEVELEDPETDEARGWCGRSHCGESGRLL
jgi:hypothetical protein